MYLFITPDLLPSTPSLSLSLLFISHLSTSTLPSLTFLDKSWCSFPFHSSPLKTRPCWPLLLSSDSQCRLLLSPLLFFHCHYLPLAVLSLYLPASLSYTRFLPFLISVSRGFHPSHFYFSFPFLNIFSICLESRNSSTFFTTLSSSRTQPLFNVKVRIQEAFWGDRESGVLLHFKISLRYLNIQVGHKYITSLWATFKYMLMSVIPHLFSLVLGQFPSKK